MPDILITDLSREQLRWVDQIIEVLGEPVDYDGSRNMLGAIEAVRAWYLVKQRELKDER